MPAAAWLRGRPDPAATDFWLDPRLPGRATEDLVRLAVAEWDSGEEWAPYLAALGWRGTAEVLAALRPLAVDDDPRARSVAAYVAGQLGAPVRALPAESAALLERMGEAEADPRVLAVIAEADRRDTYRDDGHVSARTWALATTGGKRHRATLAVRMAEVCAAHPVVWEHLAAGTLGVDQVDELGRVYANRRVQAQFADVVEPFVVVAELEPYDSFVARVRQWERLADADGSHRAAKDAHAGRRADVTTAGESTYLMASVGSAQASVLTEILNRFAQAEFDVTASGTNTAVQVVADALAVEDTISSTYIGTDLLI